MLSEEYMKTLSANKLSEILENKYDELDYLKIDLSALQHKVNALEDEITLISNVFHQKIKNDDCNDCETYPACQGCDIFASDDS